MLLQSNFYTVQSSHIDASTLQSTILINPDHQIFEGHFPGQPVVPGVCMIQIIKELVEQYLSFPVQLHAAAQVKFLQLLVPDQHKEITVQINFKDPVDDEYNIAASFIQSEKAIMKMNGKFSKK